ncbi:hypothetical protein EDB85DRAFT_2094831 [Lactarius pseudohatsudake]|nr:hypothetical protein EDB85DRAFT_2094831 [Lactarius pseudohatsudake]
MRRGERRFDGSSTLVCPACRETVHVGFGGEKNLANHRTSKACQKKSQKIQSKGPKTNQDLHAFFKPRAPLNPQIVTTPSPIHADEVKARAKDVPRETVHAPDVSCNDLGKTSELLATKSPCRKGIELLNRLEAAAKRIPASVPLATPAHRLSAFSVDPHTCVASPEEDDWLILNSMLKAAFGWGESETKDNARSMLNRGEYGLDGFIRFFKFFVLERGLEGVMIETKVDALMHELDNRYMPQRVPNSKAPSSASSIDTICETTASQMANGTAQSPIVLDEACDDDVDVPDLANNTCTETLSGALVPERMPQGMPMSTSWLTQTKPRGRRCEGVVMRFPPGKNHHTSYPFGIHNERDVPWNYSSTNDMFSIQAKLCRRPFVSEGNTCRDCHALTSTPLYVGIMDRIKHGVNENAPLVYHGVGGLIEVARRKSEQVRQIQMTKLNTSRKLLGKATALDNHKQWMMAIASGRIDRVASLVQAGLKHKAGIKTLILEYERAAEKLYQPKGYTNEDIMRSIVMLRLGGTRVAEFAHRSLSLPSPTTIRRNTVMRALIVSPSAPTIAEIKENIMSCYSGLASVGEDTNSGTCSGPGGSNIVHQVLMFDELAIERRIRWDDSSNKFLGTCREHNHLIPLNFTSEKELEILCDAIDDDKVHPASEATVAGVGVLSSIPREYAVRPIMFSGTCKRETGRHHARMIQTVLDAASKVNVRKATTYRTICIASDGEAKRGDALVILTMSSQLSMSSPIYEELSSLRLMNHLVGPDDLTADKDFKHVFKRQRNLLMRNRGVLIQGFCITPAMVRLHLESHGVPSHRLRSLLNPNDKQDVVLAYSLLKEIWSLPPPPAGSSPAFTRVREAINVYGTFARHLVMPYVSVDLNLNEQLVHLSAAAHMAFYLYRDNLARTHFMPTQSYVDIMIMIKNVYYCVAKAKVDNPRGQFYPILLGTDRLESFFGLIRTAVGTDTNVDILQLGSRASGLTEVAAILAEHPEWDNVTSKIDHISPKDWRGDASVAEVNLHTCWLLGCKEAVNYLPDAGRVFEQLFAEDSADVDILSPLGTLLVNLRDGDEEDLDDLSPEHPDNHPSPFHSTEDVRDARASLSYTHEGDLEDAMADEMPRNNINSTVSIQGQETSKAKALRHRMAYRSNRSSTDRLRRVQNIPCFAPTSSVTEPSSIPPCVDIETLGPCLRVGDPVALLVRCGTLVVLAVAQVNRLRFASQADLDELGVHLLADPTAKIDCQLLRLVPASIEDDPTQVHDWCWSMSMEATCDSVHGQYIHLLNPSISVLRPGKPTFLLQGLFRVSSGGRT